MSKMVVYVNPEGFALEVTEHGELVYGNQFDYGSTVSETREGADRPPYSGYAHRGFMMNPYAGDVLQSAIDTHRVREVEVQAPDGNPDIQSAFRETYAENLKPFQPKYEMVPEGDKFRVRALTDFGDVKAGDLGGLVDSEENLSQVDECWITKDASVSENAKVRGHALVTGTATVDGNAFVTAHAAVLDGHVGTGAYVEGNAKIYGGDIHGRIYGDANVYGSEIYGQVYGNATVHGETTVEANASVYGNARVADAFIGDKASVYGNAVVTGDVYVHDQAKVCGNAVLTGDLGDWPEGVYPACEVCDEALIDGNAKVTNAYVSEQAHIGEQASVMGDLGKRKPARIGGQAEITGNAKVSGNVYVHGNTVLDGDFVLSGDGLEMGTDEADGLALADAVNDLGSPDGEELV